MIAGVAAGVIMQPFAPASAVGIVSIAGGGFHTCVLTSTGSAQCWGRNDFGQLGDGTAQNRTTAVKVAGLTDAIALSAGGFHTCAVTASGGAKCWGRNDFGQLGDGTTTNRTTPVDVSTLGSDVSAVSAGGLHTCALTKAGAVRCWGRNDHGQVGDGSASDRHSPVAVLGLTSGVLAVAAGGGDSSGAHTCARTTAGGAKCWGRNDFGQLGDGTMTERPSPVDVKVLSDVAGIVAGRYHSCALSGGGVKCWGWNIGGQLGDGTRTTRTAPVDAAGLASGAAELSAGGMHNCALTSSGGVKCWGFNTSGELGDGTSGNSRTTPVDVLEAPAGPSLANIAAITTGGSVAPAGHSCAVTAVGGVWCWGDNFFGQLGDGTTTNRASPVGVIGFAAKPTSTETQTLTNTPTSTATPAPSKTPTPASTPTQTATPLPDCADVTGDSWVTFLDVLSIASRVGAQEGDAGYSVRFDLNLDGGISLQDLQIAASAFGRRC